MEKCWKCNGNLVDFDDEMGERCLQCGRTPNQEYEEKIEKDKAKVEGNPKSYGADRAYLRSTPDLEGFAMSLLSKMCRG